MAATPPRRAPASRWPRGPGVLGGLVVAGVVGLLALAPISAVVASNLPRPLVDPAAAPTGGSLQRTSAVRPVPVGLPDSAVIRTVDDVRPYAVAAVGVDAAEVLLSFIDAVENPPPGEGLSLPSWTYPLEFPGVSRVLDAVPPEDLADHGASFGAALMVLAAEPSFEDPFHAAQLSFAILDRTRRSGACDAQLDLMALVASAFELEKDAVELELRRTRQACPDDPSAGWLVVQRHLGDLSVEDDLTITLEFDLERLAAAEAGARALVREFPTDPGVLAALGDVHLATGRYLAVSQPFTSRRAFEDARGVFARIRETADPVVGGLGLARAELGLGRFAEAAELATEVGAAQDTPGRALQVAIRAEERAGRWATASDLARRLADLGTRALPTAGPITPFEYPQTFGADRLRPASFVLLGGGAGGGGLVADEGFVPRYRPSAGITDDAEFCPAWSWRRSAWLAGDPAAASVGWPEDFDAIAPSAFGGSCPDTAPLKRLLDSPDPAAEALALEDSYGSSDDDEEDPVARLDSIFDDRQNLFRWAGDLAAARRDAMTWVRSMGEDTALAHQRMAEIDYLANDHESAAAEFAVAAARWRALDWDNDLAVAQSELGRGGALLRSGRPDDAVAVLRPLVDTGARGFGFQDAEGPGDPEPFAKVSYYAATLLADHELASGQEQAAADDLATALTWADTLDGVVHLDAARNSAAVAALGTGDLDRALVMSTAAVQGDPRSPVYLMTAAEVSHRRGDPTRAIAQYRTALESDPSVYPAANNLAVLLARRGDLAEASRVLRAAVDAEPRYTLGWNNLGVVEGRRGPLHVPASQGALARAVALDAALADRRPELALDAATYRTSLDVSKPLPEGWSFAGSQRTAPAVTAGLLAAALAGVGLVSLRDTSPSPAAREWLEGVATRLGTRRRARWLRRPWWGLGATVLAFVLAFHEQAVWPWTGLVYVLGIGTLVGAAMLVRVAVAGRTGRGVVHGTWPPGALVGLVSGAFGAPFAPLPVVRAPSANLRVALAAPLTLAVLSLVLLAEAALLRTPLATSFCVATFIMAGSLLLPVPPLDGSRAGRAGVVGVIGLLGAVLLLGLGLV